MDKLFIAKSQNKKNQINWPYTLATLASIVVIVLGCVEILAWVMRLWFPKVFFTIIYDLSTSAALCFILAGISLWLHRDSSANKSLHYIAEFCGA